MGEQRSTTSYSLGIYQRILLEICTVLYIAARNGAIPLMQLYVYDLYKKKYGLDDIDNNANATLVPFSDDGPQYLTDKANEEASELCLYLAIAELFPSMLSTLLFGFLSDVTGKRKFMLWLPCLGVSVYSLFFALPLYINGGDVNKPVTIALLVIGCLINGACGSVSTFFCGNAVYIACTDSEERRTLRYSQVQIVVGLTYAISNLVYGVWVDATGDFLPPIWFIISCSAAAFLLMLVLLEEPRLGTTGNRPKDPLEGFRGVRELTGCSTTHQRQLWAIFLAFQLYVFTQQGQERVYVLFLSEDPFYWEVIQVSFFIFIVYTVAAFGAYPGIPILKRFVGEVLIMGLGIMCKLISSLILAFATSNVAAYLAAAVQVFLYAPFVTLKTFAIKRAPEGKQASVMGFVNATGTVSVFLGPVILETIFVASKTNAVVFMFSAVLLAVSACFTGYALYLEYSIRATDGEDTTPLSPNQRAIDYSSSGP